MSITNSTAAKNAACDAVVDLLDSGAGANGTLEILDTDGTTVLVTFNLPSPAFGSASDGDAEANAITDASASASGTAASYRAKDTDGNVVWTGSVTATGGGGDMILDNTSINAGQNVSITSWTHTALSQ